MFVDETGSDILRRFIVGVGDMEKAISVLAQVGARSAVQRRFRNREVPQIALDAAVSDLDEVRYFWVLVSIHEAVVGRAFGIIASHALRSLDALQLASTLNLLEELSPEENLLFIASDKRLLAAASAEGLAIWNPETSAPPAALPPVN
jgi:hypothetical protein